MISVAHIIPTSYLQNTPVSNFYMVLPHKLLHDTNYSNFYRRRVKEGAYVLLDNGAFEFGQSLSDELLIEAIGMLKPNEFVLPDTLRDAKTTIEKSLNFIEKIGGKSNLKFMAVAHGSSLEEWLGCYDIFSKNTSVYSIGLGAIYTKKKSNFLHFPTSKYLNGRVYLTTYLFTHGYANVSKPHHLLGLGDSGHMELTIQNKLPWIRSCDSSAAFTQSILSRKIEVGIPYTKNPTPLDFSSKYKKDVGKLLVENMIVLNNG